MSGDALFAGTIGVRARRGSGEQLCSAILPERLRGRIR
jgi:hypothetical protein